MLSSAYDIIREDELRQIDHKHMIPISLGWNCGPAQYRKSKLNASKQNGYLTCPFDLVVTPYSGLCQCILDDFNEERFFNLRVEYDPLNKQMCILNDYNMWFNRESEHSTVDPNIEWIPGKYMDDNFKLFKEIYMRRIQNYRNYILNNNILFILTGSSYESPTYIYNILKYKYPTISFKLLHVKHREDIYFKQHLHSTGFPKSINDIEYRELFEKTFKKFAIPTL